MLNSRPIRYGLPLLTAVVYGFLVFGLGMPLAEMAGGLQPFDLRIQGYDLTATQTYLAVLTDEGRALYLGPIRQVDTVFPILMTLVFLMPLWSRWRWLLALPALAYGVTDLFENAAVARILAADVPGAAQVALASALTQTKFLFFVMAAGVGLGGLWRSRHRRG